MRENRKNERELSSSANAQGESQRRLAVAAVLSLLGCDPGCSGSRAVPGAATPVAVPSGGTAAGPAPLASPLPAEAEQRLHSVWREADQIVHGERGDYPFDEAGKQRIITALKEQPAEVRRWVAAGKLKPAEGELLIEELSDLAQRVGTYRTQESIEATCYKPMVFGPGEPSPEGLEKRVPLLTKVADEQILQPEVMKKLVADCERDIAQLEEHVGLFGPKLAQTLRDARAQVARVKARLAGSGTPAAP